MYLGQTAWLESFVLQFCREKMKIRVIVPIVDKYFVSGVTSVLSDCVSMMFGSPTFNSQLSVCFNFKNAVFN